MFMMQRPQERKQTKMQERRLHRRKEKARRERGEGNKFGPHRNRQQTQCLSSLLIQNQGNTSRRYADPRTEEAFGKSKSVKQICSIALSSVGSLSPFGCEIPFPAGIPFLLWKNEGTPN